jgi:hypothetical protein
MLSNELENDPSEKTGFQVEEKKKKKLNIKWMQGANLFVGFLLIFFFFFGFICNSGDMFKQQDPGNKLLFVYSAFVNTDTFTPEGLYLPGFLEWIYLIPLWTSIFIFIGIGVYQAYKEDFLVYAIKNNIIMVVIIIVTSWIWYAWLYSTLIFEVIWWYFTSIHGYINIFVILFLYVGAGILGGYLKIKKYQKEHQL